MASEADILDSRAPMVFSPSEAKGANAELKPLLNRRRRLSEVEGAVFCGESLVAAASSKQTANTNSANLDARVVATKAETTAKVGAGLDLNANSSDDSTVVEDAVLGNVTPEIANKQSANTSSSSSANADSMVAAAAVLLFDDVLDASLSNILLDGDEERKGSSPLTTRRPDTKLQRNIMTGSSGSNDAGNVDVNDIATTSQTIEGEVVGVVEADAGGGGAGVDAVDADGNVMKAATSTSVTKVTSNNATSTVEASDASIYEPAIYDVVLNDEFPERIDVGMKDVSTVQVNAGVTDVDVIAASTPDLTGLASNNADIEAVAPDGEGRIDNVVVVDKASMMLGNPNDEDKWSVTPTPLVDTITDNTLTTTVTLSIDSEIPALLVEASDTTVIGSTVTGHCNVADITTTTTTTTTAATATATAPSELIKADSILHNSVDNAEGEIAPQLPLPMWKPTTTHAPNTIPETVGSVTSGTVRATADDVNAGIILGYDAGPVSCLVAEISDDSEEEDEVVLSFSKANLTFKKRISQFTKRVNEASNDVYVANGSSINRVNGAVGTNKRINVAGLTGSDYSSRGESSPLSVEAAMLPTTTGSSSNSSSSSASTATTSTSPVKINPLLTVTRSGISMGSGGGGGGRRSISSPDKKSKTSPRKQSINSNSNKPPSPFSSDQTSGAIDIDGIDLLVNPRYHPERSSTPVGKSTTGGAVPTSVVATLMVSPEVVGRLTSIPEAPADEEVDIIATPSYMGNGERYDPGSSSSVVLDQNGDIVTYTNGWMRYETDDGMTYYYNELTGVSQWHEPLESKVITKPPPKSSESNSRTVGGALVPTGSALQSVNIPEVLGSGGLSPVDDDSPLHAAVSYGYTSDEDLVALLNTSSSNNENGASDAVNAVTADGETPLHYASTYAYYVGIEKLIEYGADVDATDIHGQTALFNALNTGVEGIECMKYLFEMGASLEIVDYNGDSLLHLAAGLGNVDCVRFLLDNVALLIDAQNMGGCTALHIAAAANQPVVLGLLVEAGANVRVQNYSGFTPSQVAVDAGHDECANQIPAVSDSTAIVPMTDVESLALVLQQERDAHKEEVLALRMRVESLEMETNALEEVNKILRDQVGNKSERELTLESEYDKLMNEFDEFKAVTKKNVNRYRSKIKEASKREGVLERSLAAASESQQEAWLALEKEKEAQSTLALLLSRKDAAMSEAENRNCELETSVRMVEESNLAWMESHTELEHTIEELRRQLNDTMSELEAMKVSNNKVTASIQTQTMTPRLTAGPELSSTELPVFLGLPGFGEDGHDDAIANMSTVMNEGFYYVEEIDEDVTKDDINLSVATTDVTTTTTTTTGGEDESMSEWELYTDESSGVQYYYSHFTGEYWPVDDTTGSTDEYGEAYYENRDELGNLVTDDSASYDTTSAATTSTAAATTTSATTTTADAAATTSATTTTTTITSAYDGDDDDTPKPMSPSTKSFFQKFDPKTIERQVAEQKKKEAERLERKRLKRMKFKSRRTKNYFKMFSASHSRLPGIKEEEGDVSGEGEGLSSSLEKTKTATASTTTSTMTAEASGNGGATSSTSTEDISTPHYDDIITHENSEYEYSSSAGYGDEWSPASPERIAQVWGKFIENSIKKQLVAQTHVPETVATGATASSETNPDESTSIAIDPIFEAIDFHNIDLLLHLLKSGTSSPDAMHPLYNTTPLHHACIAGDINALTLLIEFEADMNMSSGEEGNTPLHECIRYDHFPCFQFLLESMASPNVINYTGDTPLHFAAASGISSYMRMLLDYDADPDISNTSGYSPLELFLQYHGDEMLRKGESSDSNYVEILNLLSKFPGGVLADADNEAAELLPGASALVNKNKISDKTSTNGKNSNKRVNVSTYSDKAEVGEKIKKKLSKKKEEENKSRTLRFPSFFASANASSSGDYSTSSDETDSDEAEFDEKEIAAAVSKLELQMGGISISSGVTASSVSVPAPIYTGTIKAADTDNYNATKIASSTTGSGTSGSTSGFWGTLKGGASLVGKLLSVKGSSGGDGVNSNSNGRPTVAHLGSSGGIMWDEASGKWIKKNVSGASSSSSTGADGYRSTGGDSSGGVAGSPTSDRTVSPAMPPTDSEISWTKGSSQSETLMSARSGSPPSIKATTSSSSSPSLSPAKISTTHIKPSTSENQFMRGRRKRSFVDPFDKLNINHGDTSPPTSTSTTTGK